MHTHRSTPAFSNSGKPCPTLADPSPPADPFARLRAGFAAFGKALLHMKPAPPFTQSINFHTGTTPFQPEALESARAHLHSLMDGFPYNFSESAPPTPKIYTDLMIDIEALADLPDSAPAQIAIVFFNRDDPKTQFLTYNYTPSPISAIRLGFKVTTDTLKWWDDQGMTIDVQDGEPFEEVLDEIAHDISTHGTKGMRIWSRGNSYDISILKLGYARIAKPLPWDFWMERDVRTWLEGTGFKSPRKNNHDARTDARNQALDIIESSQTIPSEAPAPVARHEDHNWVSIPITNRTGNKNLGILKLSHWMQDSVATQAYHTSRPPILSLDIEPPREGRFAKIIAAQITPQADVPAKP